MIKTLLLVPQIYIDSFLKRNKSDIEKHEAIQKWCLKLLKSMNYTLEVQQPYPLPHPCLLVSNHQSTYDPLMVVASFPTPLSFVSKKENAKIPIVSRWSKLMKVIFFDRESREGNISMLRQVTHLLKKDTSVLIFPEGTRSKSKNLNKFKFGSLQPAKISDVAILPVTLVNSYEISPTNKSKKSLKIIYGKPIDSSSFKEYSYEEITSRIHQEIKENLSQ